jgi:inhibitor of cysteine peptidase
MMNEMTGMKKLVQLTGMLLVICIVLTGCSNGKVYGKDDTDITVDAGKTFTIKLEENPTTGYTWEYEISDENVVALDKDDYSPDDKTGQLTGSGGVKSYIFRALKAGAAEIAFSLMPPDMDAEPTETIVFKITVQ